MKHSSDSVVRTRSLLLVCPHMGIPNERAPFLNEARSAKCNTNFVGV